MKTLQIRSVEETVVQMLKENTGTSFLDSGGASGRSWQHNAKKSIRVFEKEPTVTWDPDFGYTISLYHFLKRDLELDGISQEFNATFVPSKNWDSDIYGVSAEAKDWLDQQGFKIQETFNSYNGDSNLSQVIQGTWLELGDRHYLLLQIHGGCDVRGGYTDARLFYVPGYNDGALLEDVYGQVTKKDGSTVNVDNRYNGYSLTDEDGNEVAIDKEDTVELWLMEN